MYRGPWILKEHDRGKLYNVHVHEDMPQFFIMRRKRKLTIGTELHHDVVAEPAEFEDARLQNCEISTGNVHAAGTVSSHARSDHEE